MENPERPYEKKEEKEKITQSKVDIFVVRHLEPTYLNSKAIEGVQQGLDKDALAITLKELELSDAVLPPKKFTGEWLPVNMDIFETAAKEGLIIYDEANKQTLQITSKAIKQRYEQLDKPPVVLISSPLLRTLITAFFLKSELEHSGIKIRSVRSHELLRESGDWQQWVKNLKDQDPDKDKNQAQEAMRLWFEKNIPDNKFTIGKETMRTRALKFINLISRYSEMAYEGKLMAIFIIHNTFAYALSEDFSLNKLNVGDYYELDLTDPHKVKFFQGGSSQEMNRGKYFSKLNKM